MPTLLVAKRDGTLKKRVELDGRRKLSVGRSPRCELRLTADSVSRRHGLLFEHLGRWHLVDTGSRNGIFRDSARVQHVLLAPDRWARLGPAYFWLDEAPGRPQGPSAARIARAAEEEADDSAAATVAGVQAGPSLVVADSAGCELRRLPLAGRELVTVGRGSGCDVVLQDDSVAELHCVVYPEMSRWCVANAAPSRVATRVEGRPTLRRRLLPERLVRIGASLLWLEAPAGAGSEPQQPEPALDETIAGRLPLAGPPSSAFLQPGVPQRAARA